MSEINTIYDYLTKTTGMSVGDAWEIVNTINVSTEHNDDEGFV